MKLLYITNGINGAGGLERVLSIKASLLAEKGHEVHIMALNHAHKNPFYSFSEKIGFHSIEVGGNPLRYWNKYRKGIQNLVDKLNPDIISVCDDGLKGFFIPWFLKTKAKLFYERHVSKLIELRDDFGWARRMAVKSKWFFMECLGNRFSRFVVLTNGNLKEWPSLKNLTVIPNPLSFFPEEPANLYPKVVICVGKISYQKGQDILIQAWEKVHKKHPEWSLHLFGKANTAFLDFRGMESKNIHFFPPEKDIELRYRESSIYVMPSRFEGFGMVLIEAMACGLPCVSFDCAYGPADIIRHGEDGFLVEKENVDELADRLIQLMEDEALRRKMGAKARENVDRYKADKILDQWEALFGELLEESR